MPMIYFLAPVLVGALSALTAHAAVAGVSCHDGSGAGAARKGSAAAFERYYAAWHREARAIRFSSNTRDYIALPAYRRIIGLGRPALPFLEKKLAQDRGADFMLADAVIEICGWDRRALDNDSAQAVRDKVLRQLRGNE